MSSLVALSGCLGVLEQDDSVSDTDGDGMIDSQDYAPDDPNVQEKSDVANSGDSKPSSQPSGDSNTNKEQKQEILAAYNKGVRKANAGTTRLGASIKAYNNRNYDESITKAEEASEKYKKAENKFARATNLSLQIGHQNALDICNEAQLYALKMQLGCQYSQIAAKAAKNGNMERSNTFAQRHREKVNEAKELTVKDPPTLKNVLNL